MSHEDGAFLDPCEDDRNLSFVFLSGYPVASFPSSTVLNPPPAQHGPDISQDTANVHTLHLSATHQLQARPLKYCQVSSRNSYSSASSISNSTKRVDDTSRRNLLIQPVLRDCERGPRHPNYEIQYVLPPPEHVSRRVNHEYAQINGAYSINTAICDLFRRNSDDEIKAIHQVQTGLNNASDEVVLTDHSRLSLQYLHQHCANHIKFLKTRRTSETNASGGYILSDTEQFAVESFRQDHVLKCFYQRRPNCSISSRHSCRGQS